MFLNYNKVNFTHGDGRCIWWVYISVLRSIWWVYSIIGSYEIIRFEHTIFNFAIN